MPLYANLAPDKTHELYCQELQRRETTLLRGKEVGASGVSYAVIQMPCFEAEEERKTVLVLKQLDRRRCFGEAFHG